MKIAAVRAYPTSFPVAPQNRVALGIGTAVKRDAVVVKVTTDEGIVGWGEAHHGRAHTAVAKLIETTLRQLIVGMDALSTTDVWEKLYDWLVRTRQFPLAFSRLPDGRYALAFLLTTVILRHDMSGTFVSVGFDKDR